MVRTKAHKYLEINLCVEAVEEDRKKINYLPLPCKEPAAPSPLSLA
jgi:hypothetical protein